MGLAGTAVTRRYLASLLYGNNGFDVWIYGGLPAALLIASLAAIYAPIRRATAADPAAVLREG